MGLIKHHNGVSPDHFFQRDAHGVGKVKPCGRHDLFDEVRQHLCVGVADQGVASVGEQLLQCFVILDDAVVDDRDPLFASGVGMGVSVAGWAMGGPTGVSDADRANRNVVFDMGFQVGDFPLLFFHPKLPLSFQGGDSRAVVPPVFETGQSVNQDGVSRFWPQITYDSAHRVVKFLG